jgi:dolichol-phosphate mannosyltransferase
LPASTVIVPTFNEAANLKRVVEAVLSLSPDLSLLIVDDNSPDGTGDKAFELARSEDRLEVLQRPRKLGLGSAYREGFSRILSRGTSNYILEMDADFSHSPHMLPVLIEEAEKESADLVIGSRYTPGGKICGWNRKRLFLSGFANRLCSLLLGSRVKDYTAGFRCYRAESLRLIDLDTVRSEGFSFQVEMTFEMIRRGLKILETPIVFSERSDGASKFNSGIFAEAVLVLGLLFLKRLVV